MNSSEIAEQIRDVATELQRLNEINDNLRDEVLELYRALYNRSEEAE